jgi:hypothetical protein
MVGSNGNFSNVPDRFYEAKNMTLEVPVVLGLRLVKGKLVNFYTRFGGFFAYNFQKSIRAHDPIFPQNDSLITSGRGANFNGGIVLGLGLDIWRFNIEMRYQWGLANLYGNNVVYQDPRAGFRYSGFSVTLGFYIYQKVLK